MGKISEARCLITVGSTKFDDLIDTVISDDGIETLKSVGMKYIFVQCGDGKSFGKLADRDDCERAQINAIDGLEIKAFRGVNVQIVKYLPSLSAELLKADLIIGHAGAGTCMETLEAQKPLIAVINPKLMNNHQTELAQKLHESGYLTMSEPTKLLSDITDAGQKLFKPSPFPKPVDQKRFAQAVDDIMGIRPSFH